MRKKTELEQVSKNKVTIKDLSKPKREKYKNKKVTDAMRQEYIDWCMERDGWIDDKGNAL